MKRTNEILCSFVLLVNCNLLFAYFVYINNSHINFETKWHPKCASIEYWIPYFLYNHPKAIPNAPFIKKHLNSISESTYPNV